jgi:23S rRNA (pseudouridine1915-N3)-methyltransferase
VRLLLCAVGRLKAGPERDLVSRYCARFNAAGRSLALGPIEVVEIDESRARRPEDRKSEEAAKLMSAAGQAMTLALDEGGSTLSSEEFATRLADWRDGGAATIAVLIGGPDGLDPGVRQRAGLSLSFGRMTWPHQIVRILLAEQLYRAATILARHPYHRA